MPLKKKKEDIIYKGVKLDSYEELYAFWFFEELKLNGFVKSIETQPYPFTLFGGISKEYDIELKSKTKTELEHVINPHIYTADFLITWTQKALNIFFKEIHTREKITHQKALNCFLVNLIDGEYKSYFEVKPSFDQNNMTRLAKINIKWVYEKYDVFVNMFVPEKVFPKYFTPKRYLIQNKTTKARKINYKPVVLLQDFIS